MGSAVKRTWVGFLYASSGGRDLTPSSGFHKNCMHIILPGNTNIHKNKYMYFRYFYVFLKDRYLARYGGAQLESQH